MCPPCPLLLLPFPHLAEQVTPLFSINLSYLTPSCTLLGFFHLEHKNQDLWITDAPTLITAPFVVPLKNILQVRKRSPTYIATDDQRSSYWWTVAGVWGDNVLWLLGMRR
jgi:hypothetical protein